MKFLLPALILLGSFQSKAQASFSFCIINKTGQPVYALALENDVYGSTEDLLTTELINANDSDQISYQPEPPAGCKWDLVIDEYSDGAMHTKRIHNVDLCRSKRLVLSKRGERYFLRRE